MEEKTAPVFICFVCSFCSLLSFVIAVVFVVFFPEAVVRRVSRARWDRRETTTMPASNKGAMIYPGSALLLPCFVR